MPPAVRSILLGFIVLFGFFARAATYKAPLLDHHAWRQADTATISRNFTRERFNILYPQVDFRGSQADGYVETGLEVFAFTVAAVSRLSGFHHETGRVLSACLFIASCLLVFSFVRRRDGDETALVAAFLHAFAFPLLLFFERAFMNEALLICLSIGCLVATQRYVRSRSLFGLGSLIVLSTLIAAIKLPYLIIWAAIAGLFVEVDGWRVWRRWELWLMAAVNLVAAVAWYTHAHTLGTASGLTFGLTDKLFDAGVVFSLDFPLLLLDRMVRDLLEPIGLVAMIVGAWLAIGRRRWCEVFGLFGFAAYLVIVAVGNAQHDYYQLALMPIAAVVAAPGINQIAVWLARRRPGTREVAVSVLLGLAALSTFVRLASAHSWFEYDPADVVMCDAIQKVTAPAERFVFIGDNNPQMLFCVDRKGWLLSAGESNASRVRQAWQSGAKYAVLPRAFRRADVSQVLAEAGAPILTSRTLEVYRLR